MFKQLFCFLVFFCSSLAVSAKIDLVQVDKSTRKMWLLENGQVMKEYNIALGKNPRGHKQQEGDKKTPEGQYTLDYKKEDSAFYRAMHISYPNQQDIENANAKGIEPGGFIMIHGQPNQLGVFGFISQRFNWTNGCIALTNTEMDEFMSLVDVGTAIEIAW